MNRRWSIDDEEVKAALSGVIKSGTGSYYKMVANRCVTFRASQALKDLGMCGGIAARLLARFPMPVIPFTHNRNRTVLTEEELVARREMRAERAMAKKLKIEALAIENITRDADTEMCQSVSANELGFIPVIEAEPEELDAEGANAPEPVAVDRKKKTPKEPKIDPEEVAEDKNHCLVKRGEWFGIYHTKDATVRLISKDRDAAVAALAEDKQLRDCFKWHDN
jgi:hypothetical protein